MTRSVASTILLIFANAAYGQTTDHQPAFEVVSIKPAPPPDPRGMTVGSHGGPGTDDPGLFTGENFDLRGLVSNAYDIPHYRISAPDWMATARFNIAVKVPAGATKEQFRLMMQNMLAERFKLVVHHDKKEMQLYELVIAKGGPKLRRSAGEPLKEGDGEPDRKRPLEPMKLAADGYPALSEGTTMAMMNGRARVRYPRETIESFAQTLSYQVGRPVTDLTGLTGKYDIALFWDYGGTSDPDAGPTLEAAIQSQLGLKLESKKGPVDIVVVDHAEKVPTEN
jgi:uncharacterized protein (TIGR03435 family)